jgi:hypothetical protein
MSKSDAGFESLTDDDDEDVADIETSDTPTENLYNVQGLKLVFMFFLILMFIMSDFFADKFASQFSGSVQNLTLTNKGVFIASLVGCLLAIASYVLVHNNIV